MSAHDNLSEDFKKTQISPFPKTDQDTKKAKLIHEKEYHSLIKSRMDGYILNMCRHWKYFMKDKIPDTELPNC